MSFLDCLFRFYLKLFNLCVKTGDREKTCYLRKEVNVKFWYKYYKISNIFFSNQTQSTSLVGHRNYVVVVKRSCPLSLTASPCSCSFSRREYVNSNSNQGQTRHCAPIERSHGACFLKLILCLCLLLINKNWRVTQFIYGNNTCHCTMLSFHETQQNANHKHFQYEDIIAI